MSKKLICDDTRTLTHEQWLKIRKQGIGGSDVAAVLGISPWTSPFMLYQDKTSDEASSDGETVAMKAGKSLEGLIIRLLERKFGVPVTPAHEMACVAEKPFVMGNPDAFMMCVNGKKRIVEIKTVNARIADDEWGEGRVPPHYETQVRQYMAVYDEECDDTAYIVALPISEGERAIAAMFMEFSENLTENNLDLFEEQFGSKLIIRTLERDKEYEQALIEAETEFWEQHITAKVPPKADSPLDLDFMLRRAKPTKDEIELGEDAAELFEKFTGLDEQRKAAESQAKKIKQQADSVKAEILSMLYSPSDGSCAKRGICGDYEISYRKGSLRTSISSDSLKLLNTKYPDIYDQLSNEGIIATKDSAPSITIKKAKKPKTKEVSVCGAV